MTTLMNKLIEMGLQLGKSHTEHEFRQSIESTTDLLSADIYSILVFDSNETGTDGEGIDNLPRSYNPDDLGLGAEKRDPVVQHCRVNSSPIVWGQSTYVDADFPSMWEHIAPFGLRQGVSLALHVEKHRHLYLGFMWDRRKPLSQSEQVKAKLALQTLAVFAEPTAFRLWHPAQRSGMLSTECGLSPRERECLYWVSRGMTDDLIGRLLKISARTVRKHVDNSVLKLSAANRTEAAVTATRLGLLADGGIES